MFFGKLEQHIGNNHRIASDVGQSSTGLLISPRPSAYAKPCTPYRSCHSSFKWYTIQDPLPHRLSHILSHTYQLVTAQCYFQRVLCLFLRHHPIISTVYIIDCMYCFHIAGTLLFRIGSDPSTNRRQASLTLPRATSQTVLHSRYRSIFATHRLQSDIVARHSLQCS